MTAFQHCSHKTSCHKFSALIPGNPTPSWLCSVVLDFIVFLVKYYTSLIYVKANSFCSINSVFLFEGLLGPISCCYLTKIFQANEGRSFSIVTRISLKCSQKHLQLNQQICEYQNFAADHKYSLERFSRKFCRIHKKAPMPEPYFTKVADLDFSNLLKNKLRCRRFSRNFLKFSGTS